MLSITDRAAVAGALNAFNLDPDLRALIGLRAWQFYVERCPPHHDEITLIVVQGGDTPEVINQAVGVAITNLEPDDPGFEEIECHGLWYEIVVRSGTGMPVRILVENSPATELGIHGLCLSLSWPDEQEAL